MRLRAGFRTDRERFDLPGFRLSNIPGVVEPPPAVIVPSVGTTTPSRRQHKLQRGKLPSDTITLDNPAQAGSVLILRVTGNGTLTLNTPAGFTAIAGATHTAGSGISQSMFWKLAAGGETSVSWTASAGNATATSGELYEVQDAHTSAPIAFAGQSTTSASATSRTSGAVNGGSTSYANTLALAHWGCQAGSSVDKTTSRGFSNSVATTIFVTSNSPAPAVAFGTRLVADIGTAVSTAWTYTGDAADENLLALLLIRPAEPAPSGTEGASTGDEISTSTADTIEVA